jgi:hypothetical protein
MIKEILSPVLSLKKTKENPEQKTGSRRSKVCEFQTVPATCGSYYLSSLFKSKTKILLLLFFYFQLIAFMTNILPCFLLQGGNT